MLPDQPVPVLVPVLALEPFAGSGVLTGADRGPRRDAALLNAAGALLVAGLAADLADGVRQAAAAIDDGRAAALLEALRG